MNLLGPCGVKSVLAGRYAATLLAAAVMGGCLAPPGDGDPNAQPERSSVSQGLAAASSAATLDQRNDKKGASLVGRPRDISPNFSDLDPTDPDGASGGRVNGLASVRGNNLVFYAASEWGGLHKSTDGGLTWSFLAGHRPTVTWDVEVDPIQTKRVYATSFFDGRRNTLAGINVSGDAGATWKHPASSIPPKSFACALDAAHDEPSAFGIGIRPDDPRNVFIGTNCGLAISRNNGESWKFVDPTPKTPANTIWDVVVQAGGPKGKGIVDICGDDGHFRSIDGGNTFTGGTGGLPGGRCSIAVSPDESYVLLVAASDNSLWESDDAGVTWTDLGTPDRGQGRIPFVVSNQRANDASGANVFDLWFGDVTLNRGSCQTPAMPASGGTPRCPTGASTTGWARNFTRCGDVDGNGCAHDDAGDLVFDTNAAVDACPKIFSSDGGVYRNTDLGADCQDPDWEQPNVTPHALWVFGMTGVHRDGLEPEDLYFGLQDNGAFGTTTAGAASPTWHNEVCCDSFDVAADANRVLFSAGSFAGRAFRLFLARAGMVGASEINTYPADGLLTAFRTDESLATFGDARYVALTQDCTPGTGGCPGVNGGDGGVYITQDIDGSPVVWTELGAATEPPSNRLSEVQVAFDGTTPVFFVLVADGVRLTGGQLWRFRGTDPAGTWTRIDNTDGLSGGFNVFGVDRTNPCRIYASNMSAAGPRMVFSNDGGSTWNPDRELDELMRGGGDFVLQTRIGPTNFTGFAGYPQPSLVAFDPRNPQIIVAAGRDSGVFASINGGKDWDLVTDPFNSHKSGIAHIPRPFFAHFDHDDPAPLVNVYIGSQGRGVFRVAIERGKPHKGGEPRLVLGEP